MRWLIVLVFACRGDVEAPVKKKIDMTVIDGLVTAELARLHVDSPRALGHSAFFPLPYTDGGAGWVPITLAKDRYRVDTDIGLRISFVVDLAGRTVVSKSPDRADLEAATKLALDGEQRAVETAIAAIGDKGSLETIRVIRLDPRLPAAELGTTPASWHVIFESPHGVLMSLPGFGVTSVQ